MNNGSDPDAIKNDHWRVLAIDEFERVLILDRSNTEALNSIADLYHWSIKQWGKAEAYYRRAIEVDPRNFEALYSLAEIDWMESYKTRMDRRFQLNMSLKQKLIGRAACKEIRDHNLERVNEGIELMFRALNVLNAPDAMMYMSALYNERADIQCGSERMYAEDRATALRWVERASEARNRPEKIVIPARLHPAPPPPLQVRSIKKKQK